MSFLGQLFRYRPRELRTPLEDFLTEALAQWLRECTAAGQLGQVLRTLFHTAEQQLPTAAALAQVRWGTQHVIYLPGSLAHNKRPDLVGHGPGFFMIIENKVAAGFTEHTGTDGVERVDQLRLYRQYLDTRPEPHKAIVLVTHSTLPPEHWQDPVVSWRRISGFLQRSLALGPGNAAQFMARSLYDFLEEQQMSGVHLELADIVSQPAYLRLQQAMLGLGALGRKALAQAVQALPGQAGAFTVLLPTDKPGAFAAPAFYGAILAERTSGALHERPFFAWAGVLAQPVYSCIYPLNPEVPEVSVGTALWVAGPQPSDAQAAALDALVSALGGAEAGWAWAPVTGPKGELSLHLSNRLSLIDLRQRAGGGHWDDYIERFYQQHLKALLEALTKPSGIGGMTFEQALYAHCA
ncbi:hypothetical protein [Pseudomonas sp. NPDC007930]|uniref:hypothetical protein n=1 Tax=Pseudomonas sp. NPDC007930 TaxID=3364417 RepID=UPI0036E5087F